MAEKTRKKRVLAFISGRNYPFKLSEITQHISVPERTLRRWLALWCEEGLVSKTGIGKSTTYCYTSNSVGKADKDHPTHFQFLQPFDSDIRQALLEQIRDAWTHHSTALEGNTLTLGDTHFILNEGLTISGKPIKDHQQVIGHSTAIDLIYQSVAQPLSSALLFTLHQMIQTDRVSDIYKPQGDWKLEPNGTYAIDQHAKQHFIEYALPAHVPALMEEFIHTVNAIELDNLSLENAHHCYAKLHMGFAHIHPFWDGNGRLARLVANLPLLKAGLPPVVIAMDTRREYIECLAHYQIEIGQLTHQSGVWPLPEKLNTFAAFCDVSYQSTKTLVKRAHSQQQKRNLSRQ